MLYSERQISNNALANVLNLNTRRYIGDRINDAKWVKIAVYVKGSPDEVTVIEGSQEGAEIMLANFLDDVLTFRRTASNDGKFPPLNIPE